MTDTDRPPMDEDIRRIIERASKLEPQPAASRARVLARVAHVVGQGPVDGGGGAPEGAGRRAASRVPSPSAALFRRIWPLATSFALGSAVTALTLWRAAPAPPQKPPQIVYVDRFVERPRLPDERLPGVDSGSLAPAIQMNARTPGPARAPSAVSPTAGAPRARDDRLRERVEPSASTEGLAAERGLLNLARVALEREEPLEALATTDRHEREYPNGTLSQEREAMAIRALVALGRTGEARQRAARFRARFSNSLLLPSIEELLGREPPQ
jgi:hypothetical protein